MKSNLKRGLGKGLGALIETEDINNSGIIEVKLNDIEPNVGQPRKIFDDEKLAQLSDSIKLHGVVQPLIVSRSDGRYKIVAGERRWRAARMAGLQTVPVIVRDFSSKQVMEVALIENIQREDLNPIEEAEAYENLMKEYSLTQEEISVTIGKSRSAIANSVRLLSLQEKIRDLIISGEISSGHGRALLSIENKALQIKAVEEILKKGLSVRETETLVKRLTTKKVEKKHKEDDIEFKAIEDRLREIFGTKVQILNNRKKGKILIEYYSQDELDRIITMVEGLN